MSASRTLQCGMERKVATKTQHQSPRWVGLRPDIDLTHRVLTHRVPAEDHGRHELTLDGSPPLPKDYTVGYDALLDVAFDYDCVNPSTHVLSLYAEL